MCPPQASRMTTPPPQLLHLRREDAFFCVLCFTSSDPFATLLWMLLVFYLSVDVTCVNLLVDDTCVNLPMDVTCVNLLVVVTCVYSFLWICLCSYPSGLLPVTH